MAPSHLRAAAALALLVAVASCTAHSPLPQFQRHHKRVLRAEDSPRRLFRASSTAGDSDALSCPVPPPTVPLPSPLSANTTQHLQALREALDRMFATAGATGGIATLVYDQDILLTHGYGSTRYGTNITVTGDTVFRMGSVSKTFTDVMMFHLRDAGKLCLEDQVGCVLVCLSSAWASVSFGKRDLNSHRRFATHSVHTCRCCVQVSSIDPSYNPRPHPGTVAVWRPGHTGWRAGGLFANASCSSSSSSAVAATLTPCECHSSQASRRLEAHHLQTWAPTWLACPATARATWPTAPQACRSYLCCSRTSR